MKTILKNVMLLLLIVIFVSCKDDENVTIDEQTGTLESLEKLEQDSEYIGYVNQIYVTGKKIQDPGAVMNILDNTSNELGETKKEELVLAMGFTTVADLEKFYTSQRERLSSVIKRYDLESNDVDIAEIYNNLMRSNRNNEFATTTQKSLKVKGDLSPWCQDIWDVCDDTLFVNMPGLNNPDYVNEYFCSSFTVDSSEWSNCVNIATTRMALDWKIVELDWCLCMQRDCNWPQEVYDACYYN